MLSRSGMSFHYMVLLVLTQMLKNKIDFDSVELEENPHMLEIKTHSIRVKQIALI